MSTTTVSNGAVFGSGSSVVVVRGGVPVVGVAPPWASFDDELQPPSASQAAPAADAAKNDRRVISVTQPPHLPSHRGPPRRGPRVLTGSTASVHSALLDEPAS